MPLLLIGALGLGGLWLSRDTMDSATTLTKWLVVAAVVYGGGKIAKVW